MENLVCTEWISENPCSECTDKEGNLYCSYGCNPEDTFSASKIH